jgi:DNA-binding LacI/PurR family transcriptional regulator
MQALIPQIPRRTSLVGQTVQVLRDELRSGRWPKLLPGEHELCGQLHVSRVTLRAALKQLEREGWLQTSQGRRRQISNLEEIPSETRNRSIVLLSPERLTTLSTFAVFWMDCLREQLSHSQYQLEVHVSRSVYRKRSEKALGTLADTLSPAMWVLYHSTYEMQQWFSRRALPCIITGSRHPGIDLPSLDADYRATCRHAAGQFISHGHTHIALLNPATGTGGELESEQGFQEAFSRTAAPGAEGIIARHDGTVGSICKCLDGLFRRPTPPTALLVSRPTHLLTAMSYLARRGIRIPQNVAIISRDNDSFLEHVVPSVAHYASDPMLFAQKLSRVVLEIAEGRVRRAEDHRIMPRFVPGETFR